MDEKLAEFLLFGVYISSPTVLERGWQESLKKGRQWGDGSDFEKS